ncbi:hypothetical protein JBE04_20130 [Streptomyces sp. PRKS01-29]|nr:hypothetical protein [Streptomyces sabulosicollis]MBI0296703.1 hypothetical protein [Streptomyces sabulosicollis]
MSSPLSHPLVRTFLSSVERQTAALPAAWREELLEDLREEIAAALAEDLGGEDDSAVAGDSAVEDERVRQVLDWIGTPEEIAADALAEESGTFPPEPEDAGATWVTLGLAVLPVPLCLVPGVGIPLGLVAALGALVRLWRSAPWARREKRQATLFVLSPLVTVPVLAAALSLAFDGISAPAFVASLLMALTLPVVGAIRLARSAARLRERAGA